MAKEEKKLVEIYTKIEIHDEAASKEVDEFLEVISKMDEFPENYGREDLLQDALILGLKDFSKLVNATKLAEKLKETLGDFIKCDCDDCVEARKAEESEK